MRSALLMIRRLYAFCISVGKKESLMMSSHL